MEEQGFRVLLERVEQQYQLLSEKVGSLDQKIDGGLRDVRREMSDGFGDMRTGIKGLVEDIQILKQQSRARGSNA